MGLDLLLAVPIIVAILVGFRDGLVRKLVAIAATVAALFLAQFLMADAGNALVEAFDVDKSSAPVLGYFSVFFGILILQSLLYRLLAKGYKIGGIADRIIGSVLGFVQASIVVSAILMMLATQGWPSRQARKESRLYRSLVNIAPSLLDTSTTLLPEAQERLKELTRPQPVAPAPPPQEAPKR